MKIKTSQVLKDLDGRNIKDGGNDFTIGKAIARIITAVDENREIDSLKAYILAQKFYSEDEVDLDDADYEIIKKSIERDKTFSPLVNGQVLQLISKQKK